MKIPSVSTYWQNKDTKELSSVAFDVFCLKIEDTLEEFGGERKQTKVDTIINGLLKNANHKVAEKLAGQKVILSNKNKPLYLTGLPTNILESFALPPDLENDLSNKAAPAPANTTTNSFLNAFGNISNTAKVTTDKRVAYGGKELFKQIAAFLKLTYASEDDSLYFFEVQKEPCPNDVVGSILQNGEKHGTEEKIVVCFGFQKKLN